MSVTAMESELDSQRQEVILSTAFRQALRPTQSFIKYVPWIKWLRHEASQSQSTVAKV
jgi:hypothetical protein